VIEVDVMVGDIYYYAVLDGVLFLLTLFNLYQENNVSLPRLLILGTAFLVLSVLKIMKCYQSYPITFCKEVESE